MAPRSTPVAYVDLHTHTTESDGTLSPEQLVLLAVQTGLSALAITDHDTFTGFEQALPKAKSLRLELVRGIELNSNLEVPGRSKARSAHLLAYFPAADPATSFLDWLAKQREERRDRNRKLASVLQEQNILITLDEVEARGRSLTGRTHFAQLLLEKGYVSNFDEAFTRFLGEDAPTHVERQSYTTEVTIDYIRRGGGVPVLAHPVRLGLARAEEAPILERLKRAGLLGLEVYHSDHPRDLQAHYHALALDLGLAPTGGSDFHGAIKPHVQLGTGVDGNVRAPRAWLDALREMQTKGMEPQRRG